MRIHCPVIANPTPRVLIAILAQLAVLNVRRRELRFPKASPVRITTINTIAGAFRIPPSAVHVQCGDTICGSSYHHDLPDKDFYEVVLTTRDTLTWCVEADFDVAASIMMGYTSCSSPVIYTQGSAPACVPLCLSMCLDPGIYWLTVIPTNSLDFGYPPACKEYVASVHCAPCPGGQTCIYPDLDFDPTNETCSFSNVQLSCADTICGEIVQAAAPDQDWYTFNIPAGTPCQRVMINLYGNDTPGFFPFAQGLDPAIQLYAADCTTLLSQDNNSGFGNDALLTTTCLTPGWYHIRVVGASNTMGPYVMAITCYPCACPPPCPYQSRDFEPANDNCPTAPAEFVCGDTLCGEILLGPSVDQDWYLFFVFGPNCQRITLDVFANGTPGYFGYLAGLDPVVELWDATCTTQIAMDDNSGVSNDSRLNSACLTPVSTWLESAERAGAPARMYLQPIAKIVPVRAYVRSRISISNRQTMFARPSIRKSSVMTRRAETLRSRNPARLPIRIGTLCKYPRWVATE
jgi:hypothetical protein